MSRVQVLRTVAQVRAWRTQCLFNRESVGFVPTMGALHAGHCHLVAHSIKENAKTIVSIFVNPSQFAPHEDLDAYPRALDSDLKTLEKFGGVDAVFVPKVLEMFPVGVDLEVLKQKGAFVTVHGCLEQLEGALRPAFFRGVATVVAKLLNVVSPTNVYFGQKDAQQCVVVGALVRDLLMDTTVRVVPTLREPNGLAMLLRNEYLLPASREKAGVIYRGLQAGQAAAGQTRAAAAVVEAVRAVYREMDPAWEVEYIEVSHPTTLERLAEIPKEGATLLTAVRVPRAGGTARLIDNVYITCT